MSITPRVQTFFNMMVERGLCKNMAQMTEVWQEVHKGNPCTALITTEGKRKGEQCGRPCVKGETTCMPHLSKEKKEAIKAAAAQDEEKVAKKARKSEEKKEKKEAKKAADKAQKLAEKAQKPKKVKKVKEEEKPKESVEVEEKPKKVKKTKQETKQEDAPIPATAMEVIPMVIPATAMEVKEVKEVKQKCCATTKTGKQCANNALEGTEKCKQHS